MAHPLLRWTFENYGRLVHDDLRWLKKHGRKTRPTMKLQPRRLSRMAGEGYASVFIDFGTGTQRWGPKAVSVGTRRPSTRPTTSCRLVSNQKKTEVKLSVLWVLER
jgi:hypothetical protein